MPVWKGCVMKACLPCVHNRWDRIEAGGVWQGTISLPEGQSESPTSWLALSFGAAGVTQQRAQAFPAGSSELGRNPRSLHGAAPKKKRTCSCYSNGGNCQKWFLPLREFVPLVDGGPWKLDEHFTVLLKPVTLLKGQIHPARRDTDACSRLKF